MSELQKIYRRLRSPRRWFGSAVFRARKAGDDARDRRQWSLAAESYEAALRLDSSALDIVMQLGHAYKELGLYDAAHAQYQKVLEADPKNDDLFLQLGHLEKLRGRADVAAQYYHRCLELNPANTHAQLEYAELNSKLKAAIIGDSAQAFSVEAGVGVLSPVSFETNTSPAMDVALSLPTFPLRSEATLLVRPLAIAGNDPAGQSASGFLDRVNLIQEQLSTRL